MRLRTLQANGEYKYSALGKTFFRFRQVDHIVHVPVVIEGRRKNGTTYSREDYLPYDSLSMERIMSSALLTEAQRDARVRTAVLQALQLRTLRGRPVLLEVSEETYFYDRTRPWRISSLTTTPHDGAPETHAALNRPMGALYHVKNQVNEETAWLLNHRVPQNLLSSSFVPHADQVIDEAWVLRDDKLCVIRQLAAILKEQEKDLIDEFDRLLQRPWQHEGLSPNDVKTFCQERKLPYYCLGRGLMDSWQPEAAGGRAVAFTTWDGHCYMYKSARVVSDWVVAAPHAQRAQLASEVVSSLPPVTEWKEWGGACQANRAISIAWTSGPSGRSS